MTKRDGKQMRLIHLLCVFAPLMLNQDPIDDIARAGDNRLISRASDSLRCKGRAWRSGDVPAEDSRKPLLHVVQKNRTDSGKGV